MDGMSIWWDEPILGSGRDSSSSSKTSSTEGVNSDNKSKNTSGGQKQDAAFVQAWEEAHRLFREKRQQEKESKEEK